MSGDSPDSDLAQLAAQISAIASAPIEQLPELRAHLPALAASVAALARALEAPADDAAARARIADEIDRARAAMVEAMRAAAPVIARAKPEVRAQLRGLSVPALAAALALVAGWLRAPTPENTAAVERLVAAIRAVPGAGEALWRDEAAEARREAELDADVQKSLDEIQAGMPKLEL